MIFDLVVGQNQSLFIIKMANTFVCLTNKCHKWDFYFHSAENLAPESRCIKELIFFMSLLCLFNNVLIVLFVLFSLNFFASFLIALVS